MKFILASESPRRKQILGDLGIPFQSVTSEADESYTPGLEPADIVMLLSTRKAMAVQDRLEKQGEDLSDTVIMAFDTVVFAAGEVLGKPENKQDALRMLRLLAGRSHSVLTGVSVICNGKSASSYDETFVKFTPMSDSEMLRYVDSEEPADKAGAYAIQGRASLWVEGISGNYQNVVGLPVSCLNKLLKTAFDIHLSDWIN